MPEEPRQAIDEGEEPVITGTLFLTALLLVLIVGFWVLMFVTLLER